MLTPGKKILDCQVSGSSRARKLTDKLDDKLMIVQCTPPIMIYKYYPFSRIILKIKVLNCKVSGSSPYRYFSG